MSKRFTMVLRDRTVADLRAGSAPAVSFWEQRRRHRRFYLKSTEDALILRCWTQSRSELGWSLKATMHPDQPGVRVDGRIRCRAETIMVGLFGGYGVVFTTVAVAAVFSGHPKDAFLLGPALLFLAVPAIVPRVRRKAMEERDALARRYLRSLPPSRSTRPDRRRSGQRG